MLMGVLGYQNSGIMPLEERNREIKEILLEKMESLIF